MKIKQYEGMKPNEPYEEVGWCECCDKLKQYLYHTCTGAFRGIAMCKDCLDEIDEDEGKVKNDQ